jgi:CheY-like chemotaxis protein
MSGDSSQTIILMADDDHDDQYLVQEAWEELELDKGLKFVSDGEELMKSLLDGIKNPDTFDGLPSLILLDLNMPRKNGRKSLQEIKANPYLRHIPVIILTTSKDREEIHYCYQLGAAGFITKPATFEDLLITIKNLYLYWFNTVSLPGRVANG